MQTSSSTTAPHVCAFAYRFTGKERDTESGLDYFGARFYSAQWGRFMSPDSGVDQHPENPQTWNLYSYVRNNPLSLVDPKGEYVCGSGVTQSMCDQFQKGLDAAQQAADKLKDAYGDKSSQNTTAQRAIDAYGQENRDNGVTVQVGNTGSYGGSTDVKADSSSPTGARVMVTLGNGDFDGSAYSGIGAAHEGPHVADAQDWIASGFNPAQNPTSYNTEFRAYLVTAHLAEGAYDLGMIGPDFSGTYGNHRYVIWQAGAMPSQAKAPGKPGEKEGFVDPKSGPKWGKAPNGKSGWVDAKGNVWVPTGQAPGIAHGGPQRDVQLPRGGYQNVRPGGQLQN
jgi:RHS repeat-associated protein